MLEGFEKFSVSPGLAAITITINGIGFSKMAVQRMEKCEYVIAMIDYNGRRFAIQKCESNEEGATKFYRGQKTTSVRWNNRELTKTLCDLMGWDIKTASYRVEGTYNPGEKALIFNLNQAREVNK